MCRIITVGSIRRTPVRKENERRSNVRAKVSIVRAGAKDFDEHVFAGVRKSIDLVGGVESFAKRGDSVLVKPNIVAAAVGAVTDRRVTFAVAKLFADHGCKVLVGDDPHASVRDTGSLYDFYGLEEVAARAGAEVVDLRSGPKKKISLDGGRVLTDVEVSQVALEADAIVSVPVLKSHPLTTITLGMKNMKGVLPRKSKMLFHEMGVAFGVAELCKVLPLKLTVIDGIIGQDMWAGQMKPTGVILAGGDPVATDAVGASVMGYDPKGVDHLSYAVTLGLGTNDLDAIEVAGDVSLEDARTQSFTMAPDPRELCEKAGISLVEGAPCSGCLAMISDALDKMKPGLREKFRGWTMVVGPKAKAPDSDRVLVVGRCLGKYREKLPIIDYCPPESWRIIGKFQELAAGMRSQAPKASAEG